ncbi:hypothetical protein [Ruegeria sp. HKCCA4707]|uniref:hypothetical protein n=1 Tax=Ruegeria sp. HKCCA4707 TaxID=2682984 RepID=UPI0014878B4F|nr:hypothetical protein [Ruegeria sp. HKCCA4707]
MDAQSLYQEAFTYTAPIDGQFPRPWMTDLSDPSEANCFIVGRNQRNGYAVDLVGSQERHVDALFNRNGQSCRGLYEQLCETSPTRKNIDQLSERLKHVGAKVLETNVVCFSTPMSADLTEDQRRVGTKIFEWVHNRISPKVVVVHGRGAAKDLARLGIANSCVIEMPSLAPPAYNRWHSRSEAELDRVAEEVRQLLSDQMLVLSKEENARC